jgi:hypothetical protein
MTDVRFRNLDHVPLQEEFTPSVVYKISTASKIAALAIGIVSLCVFSLSDNAKTAITTISRTDVDGKCTMLSSVTVQLAEEETSVSASVKNEFVQGYLALMKEITGVPRVQCNSPYQLEGGGSEESGPNYLGFDRVHFLQTYFSSYQNCIQEFSKPPVCFFEPLTDSTPSRDRSDYDKPLVCLHTSTRIPLPNFFPACRSVLRCFWPNVGPPKMFPFLRRVFMNLTNFKCDPSANFTTCDSIHSKCPEYERFANGYVKLFQRINPPEVMCQTFKDNPPYSCQTFQVLSPIQVISQTLSLMATTLGGSELFLYAMMKYRHMFARKPQIVPAPVSNTLKEAQ